MSTYIAIVAREDLHCYDPRRNHDKVYHVAVLQRRDGKYDLLYRHGRRGKGMQGGMKSGGYSNPNMPTSEMSGIASTKRNESYQDAPNVTPGVLERSCAANHASATGSTCTKTANSTETEKIRSTSGPPASPPSCPQPTEETARRMYGSGRG